MPVALLNPDRPPIPKVQSLASGLQVVTSGEPYAYFCRVCQLPFLESEQKAWIQHTIHCAKEHEEAIREHRDLGTQMPGLFGPDTGDVEKKAWLRQRKGWRC